MTCVPFLLLQTEQIFISLWFFIIEIIQANKHSHEGMVPMLCFFFSNLEKKRTVALKFKSLNASH